MITDITPEVTVENIYDWEWLKTHTYYPHWAAKARRIGMDFYEFREMYQDAMIDAFMSFDPAKRASFKTYSYNVAWKAFLYCMRDIYSWIPKDTVVDAEKFGKLKQRLYPQEWCLEEFVEDYLKNMSTFINMLIDDHPSDNRDFLANWRCILTWRCCDGMTLKSIGHKLRTERNISKQAVYKTIDKIKAYIKRYLQIHENLLETLFDADALFTVRYALKFKDHGPFEYSIIN